MTDVVSETPFYTGPVRWVADLTATDLEGFAVVTWPELVDGWIARARNVGVKRDSLASAAKPWLDWLDQVDRLAVIGVELDDATDAADLLGFVVEPATRRGIELAIESSVAIEDLKAADFHEPEMGYPHSFERLRWRLRGIQPPRKSTPTLKDTEFRPDPTQAAAVEASDGAVQIIAPAGSGKTTVLVERVRELRRRGISAPAIACLTFNRAAKKEMEERLQDSGVGSVQAFTFHGLGRRILVDAGALSQSQSIGSLTLGQWRRLVTAAKRKTEDGAWIEPGDASARLSQIKLGLLMEVEEYAEMAARSGDDEQRTMATLYRIYEDENRKQKRIDYDDLVLRAVRLLQADAAIRGQWQTRFQQLLVDEYQDIEPAQELIVRIVAAPHDQLFCVGDEDQTLYAFRRASVERIIRLDGLYPGLQRVSLGVNYRCPVSVVEASRALIGTNEVRFPKSIEPRPGAAAGVIESHPFARQVDDCAETAKLLKTLQRGEVAVLARTTNALRPLALACADHGVGIDGNEKLFKPRGARLALQRHLQLALAPEHATPELVRRVCQTPSRNLNEGAEHAIAAKLEAGQRFEMAFEKVDAPARGRGALLAPGELFSLLQDCESAAEAVLILRGEGGLESWFAEDDSLGGADPFECEVLELAEREAAGRTPAEFLGDLREQARKLEAIRDRRHGIEFLTIHGAKGRQWSHVIVIGCEEGTMPHARALQVELEQEEKGEGIEAERRLAYVAFTRAEERLDLHFDEERPSPFLREAGILARTSRAARKPPPPPMPRGGEPDEAPSEDAAVAIPASPSRKRGLGGLLRRGLDYGGR